MKLFNHKGLIILFFVFSNTAAAAEQNPGEMRFLRYDQFSYQDLEITQVISDVMASLDYWEDELPYVYLMDINQDGHDEIFLGSPEYRLCGSAGCPYFMVNGTTGELIGEFFGTLVLTENYVNDYPVIQAISRLDMEYTNLHTYVYDAETYKIVSHAILDSKGMDEWSKDIQ